MSEPVPFVGWIQDVEDTEEMLRKQIHIVQDELNRLKEENLKLRRQVEELMSERW